MQRRDYVLLSLCTPFMTVWRAKWRSVNNKWKEEITVFYICSYFCFLVCCCFFFRTRNSLLEWPSARRFQTTYAKKRLSSFIFFLFAHPANVFWNGQVTLLINEMQRGDYRLVFVRLFFFAYPANVCLNGQVTFSYNICKKEIIVSYFLFWFCFLMDTSQMSAEMAKWIFTKQ